jgi:hypothetical protein
MSLRKVLFIFALCFGFPILVSSQARVRSTPKRALLPQPRGSMKKSVLPDQPRCNTQALPDIIIEEFQFSGPGGRWRPSKRYGVSVVLKNRGQCDSGQFFVKLMVRVQSQGNDETMTVGTIKMNSIPPARTGTPGRATAAFNYTTADYPWAMYTFTAVADSTNHIEEFDEGNNSKTSIDQTVDINR